MSVYSVGSETPLNAGADSSKEIQRRRVIFPTIKKEKYLRISAKNPANTSHHNELDNFSQHFSSLGLVTSHLSREQQLIGNYLKANFSKTASSKERISALSCTRDRLPSLDRATNVQTVDVTCTEKRKRSLSSILRRTVSSSHSSAHDRIGACGKVSNPSLPSLASLDECSQSSNEESLYYHQLTENHSQNKSIRHRRKISFNPRVWIRIFQRSEEEIQCTWYTDDELNNFKQIVIQRIVHFDNRKATNIIPTGTGQVLYKPVVAKSKIVYSHAALSLDAEVDENDHIKKKLLKNEIKQVLLVDTHNVFLNLLSKAFEIAMPQVSITKAKSGHEALYHIERQRKNQEKSHYDIILIEERLKPFQFPPNKCNRQSANENLDLSSGSSIIKFLSDRKIEEKCLFIGLSAHLKHDFDLMKSCGADFCWGKPPPQMNRQLVDEILKKLLSKRKKYMIFQRYFDG